MSKIRCYVARKECGCIVAAFPVSMDKAVKGKILEQLAKAGLDIEQTSDYDVRQNFNLICDHNRPPLLTWAEDHKDDAAEDDGVGAEDVEAMSEEATPEAEEALEQEEAEEDEALAEVEWMEKQKNVGEEPDWFDDTAVAETEAVETDLPF